MHQPTITIIGHTCIDKNTIDNVKIETWGSPAMYMATYYLQNYDIKSHILSRYGHDFSRYTDKFLFTEKPDNNKTLVYENIVNNGQRTQYCHSSDSDQVVELRKDTTDLIQKTDILIVAPQLPNYSKEYIEEIIKLAPKNCLKVILPQGYMRQIGPDDKVSQRDFTEAALILPYFDVVIASEEDYSGILDLAPRWSEYKQHSSIIITQAEKGATVFDSGKSEHIAAKPIPFGDIKNPVGSGDVFSAQVAIGLYNKLSPYEAVDQANKATAKSLLSEPAA